MSSTGLRRSDGARADARPVAARDDASQYRRVLHYLLPYKFLMLGGFLAAFVFALLDSVVFLLIVPLTKTLFSGGSVAFGDISERMQYLLDNTIGRIISPDMPPMEALQIIIATVLVVVALKNVFDYLQMYLTVMLEQSVSRDLRNDVYRHVLDLDLRFFSRMKAGQVISRLTSETDTLRNLVTRNLSKFATSVLQVLVTIVFMVLMSPRLTVVALVVLPMAFGIWRRLLAPLRRGDRRILNIGGEVTSHLQETVAGIRQVKAAAAEDWEKQRFSELTRRHYKAFVRAERVRALASPLSETMGAIGTVLLLLYGGHLVLVDGSLEAGAFLAFAALSLKLYSPVKWLTKFPSTIQPGLSAAERVFEFLDTPVEMREPPNARIFQGFERAIRFERVGFHYVDGEAVLRDVSFEVKPGEVVAIVGPSGAGKTTLVDLTARFYDPTSGRITLDGHDLREFNARSLRARFGIVTQETVLFHDTVRANIAYALPNATNADVERAARAANAHDFIMRLPDEYETVLGERATRLSGGQRQRIAIARAILRDPPILIFDEATSALDSESERLVQEAIEHLLAGRTVFVIAHRLSTIRHADQILVMEEGRIVQRGRHEELLARAGLYKHLHSLQFAPPEAGAATS